MVVDCRVVSKEVDGLGRYAMGLAGALLHRTDVRVTLIVPPERARSAPLGRLLEALRPDHVTVAAPLLSVAAHLIIGGVVRTLRADLFHYPHFDLPVSVRTPSVITLHDLTPLLDARYFAQGGAAKRAYFRWVTARSTHRARAIIAPTRATADVIAQTFRLRPGRVYAIHEGVDGTFGAVSDSQVARFRQRHGLASPYLLYAGVRRPHKNLPRVVEAFAMAARDIPHDLVLAGQRVGSADELDARIAGSGVAGRIRQIGYLPEEELRAAYSAADAFVLCSTAEGFGLGVVEAMRAGTPVIASRDGAIGEVAGNAARLVDPLSPRDIADGMIEVGNQPGLQSILRERGLRRAAEFTWEAAAARTVGVYRTALGL